MIKDKLMALVIDCYHCNKSGFDKSDREEQYCEDCVKRKNTEIKAEVLKALPIPDFHKEMGDVYHTKDEYFDEIKDAIEKLFE